MKRVVFYSKEDLSAGNNLLLAEDFLNNLETRNNFEINDIIEIYNINLFYENDIFLSKWNDEEKHFFVQKCNSAWQNCIGLFMSWISENGLRTFSTIEFEYRKHFWEIIERLKLYNKIDKNELKKTISNERFFIREILLQPNTVLFFNTQIKEYFVENMASAEILLSYFEEEHHTTQEKLHFPKSLTEEIKEQIVVNYLNCERPNLNYVRLILKARTLKISDRIKFEANKISERLNEEIVEKGVVWKNSIELSVSKDQIQPKTVSISENKSSYSYSEKVLMRDFSPETILGNFISIFEYLDRYGCISLIPKIKEIDTFELAILTRSKSEYFVSSQFFFRNMLSQMQFEIYTYLLDSKGITIEKVLKQIINEYIDSEFNLKGFRIIIPNENTTILEKIRLIAPEIESLLRQYDSYAEEGYINFELIQFSSSQLHFSNIKSLLNNKYIYVNGMGGKIAVIF